jgi:hypothetical protein
MSQVVIMARSLGLYTTVDKTAVPFDPETGKVGLQAAVNISHRDHNGRPGLRPGQIPLHVGSYHSGFARGDSCFFIQERTGDAAIMRFNRDRTLTGVRDGLTKGKRMSWEEDGGIFYYSNTRQNGVIKGTTSEMWPDQTAHHGSVTDRVFSVAPRGKHLCVGLSRMWIAVDNHIYYSEPHAFGKFRLGSNSLGFLSPVLMIRVVDNGIFVGDTTSIHFFAGTDPAEMQRRKVADYPVREWSITSEAVSGASIGIPDLGDEVWHVVTKRGLCALGSTGLFINRTESRIVYPGTDTPAASLVYGSNIIHCIE